MPLIDTVANVVLLGFDDRERLSIIKKIEKCGCRVIAIQNKRSRLQMSILIANISVIDVETSLLYKYARFKRIPIIAVVDSELTTRSALQHFIPEQGDILRLGFTFENLAISMKRCLHIANVINENHQRSKRLKSSAKELRRVVKMLKQDQEAARGTQLALAPRSPAIYESTVFRHLLLPSHYLSGDFVHYARLQNNRILFYLLDVSGHGAASAFVTVMVRQLIASAIQYLFVNKQLEELEQAPLSFIRHINQEFYKAGLDKHLTIFIGNLNLESQHLNYIIGGHSPLPILIENKKARFLTGAGPPLGLFENAEWQQHSIELPQNYKLVCFSDGIYDLLNPSFTTEEKNEILLKKSVRPVRNLRAFMKIFHYSKSIQLQDDISLLSIENSV